MIFQKYFDAQYYNEGDGEDVKPTFEMSDDEYGNIVYSLLLKQDITDWCNK